MNSKMPSGDTGRIVMERIKLMKVEQQPIMRELAQIGIYMQRVDEALLSKDQFRQAAPIFLKHLHTSSYSQMTMEAIVGVFERKEASLYWQDLAELFRSQPAEKPREQGNLAMTLAAALGASAQKENLPELIDLLRDRRLRDRGLLLRPLRRRRAQPEIAAVVEELRRDPEFAKEINSWKSRK